MNMSVHRSDDGGATFPSSTVVYRRSWGPAVYQSALIARNQRGSATPTPSFGQNASNWDFCASPPSTSPCELCRIAVGLTCLPLRAILTMYFLVPTRIVQQTCQGRRRASSFHLDVYWLEHTMASNSTRARRVARPSALRFSVMTLDRAGTGLTVTPMMSGLVPGNAKSRLLRTARSSCGRALASTRHRPSHGRTTTARRGPSHCTGRLT